MTEPDHDDVSRLREVGDEIGGPADAALAQPGGEKTVAAMFGEHARDRGLIGLGGGGAEGERDLAEAKLEQPVAAPRLAVIVALRRGPGEDLDLAVVEAEAAIDRGDLRLDRALVRQEQPRRAALDDGGRDRRAIDVGQRLGGEDDGGVLLAQRLQPFAELAGKALVVERQPAFVDDQQGRPAVEPVVRCGGRDRPAPPARRSVPISPSVSKAWTEASPSRSASASSSRP